VEESVKDKNERERREKLEQEEAARIARGKKKRTFELNLDPEYWSKRFLFPYSLNTTPLRLPPPN
jgi:hypothetical protein